MEIDIYKIAESVSQQRTYKMNLSIMAERLQVDKKDLQIEMLDFLKEEVVYSVLEECNVLECF